MNHSGEAAEQIVRLTLEGVEVAAKITGNGAKEIALFLLAAMKSKDKNLKLRGKARMTSMLKSGKALEIFSIRESDLRKFAAGAKRYGIVYCALRNAKGSPDGLCDVMVRADDAPKISRLVERFHFATVDRAKIKSEIAAEKAGKTASAKPAIAGAKPEAPDRNDVEKLLDEFMGPETPEAEKAESEKAGKEPADSRPLAAGGREPPNGNPSGPTFEDGKKSERTTLSSPPAKSVKRELREIAAARKEKEAAAAGRGERALPDKPRNQAITHKPPRSGKPKSKKMKGSR